MTTHLNFSWQIMPPNEALLPQIPDPICDQEFNKTNEISVFAGEWARRYKFKGDFQKKLC